MKQNPGIRSQVTSIYQRFETYMPAAFFLLGFIFDLLTLNRIDNQVTIIQQAAYLILITIILTRLFLKGQREINMDSPPPLPGSNESETKRSGKPGLIDRWQVPALHFLFGSLLSAYTIFYFKSSSLAASILFLGLLCVLLVANEMKTFQSLDIGFKSSLLALSLFSYAAYVLPIFIGFTGTGIFLLSLAAGSVYLIGFAYLLTRLTGDKRPVLAEVLNPSAAVLIVFLGLYLLKAIPPVPLSLQYVGIFHNVERTEDGKYKLSHEKDFWRFWHHGDQIFKAQPGDRIFVFFRLFSPAEFTDQVYMKWFLHDDRHGWVPQDSIPIQIRGGREEGFRGYGFKGNYSPGEWMVTIETTDHREIGRILLWVHEASETSRQLIVETH